MLINVSEINITENVALVTFNNVPCSIKIVADIFIRVADGGINIDMISQSAPMGEYVTLSFTLESKDIGTVLLIINEIKKDYSSIKANISDGYSKIQFFDKGMKKLHGVASKILELASTAGADVALITTSEIDVSLLVDSHRAIDILELGKQ